MAGAAVVYPKPTTFSKAITDGRLLLTPNGSSKALSADYSAVLQQWLHALRSARDAVMVGAGAVVPDLRTQGLSAEDLHWRGRHGWKYR
jgi:hypothetical protein